MLDFKIGNIYHRSEIHDQFGGQRQYGISTPHKFNIIFLFTGQSGKEHGYNDGWRNDRIFLYSGEGQTGDMTFTRGNKEIRDHQETGKELHLFEIIGGGQVKYLGQMVCLEYRILDEDTRGITRKTIQFELAPIEFVDASEEDVKQ
jgi:5-methylcytosine-specific restriction enzyme A